MLLNLSDMLGIGDVVKVLLVLKLLVIDDVGWRHTDLDGREVSMGYREYRDECLADVGQRLRRWNEDFMA